MGEMLCKDYFTTCLDGQFRGYKFVGALHSMLMCLGIREVLELVMVV